MLSPYSMFPRVLLMVCVNHCISGDHINWLFNVLNKSQSLVYCLYINNFLQRDPSALRLFSNESLKPQNLLFAVNVGHSANGFTYLGTDDLPCVHWTICLGDIYEKSITYGDSLAWLVPDGLDEKVYSFVTVCGADYKGFNKYLFKW